MSMQIPADRVRELMNAAASALQEELTSERSQFIHVLTEAHQKGEIVCERPRVTATLIQGAIDAATVGLVPVDSQDSVEEIASDLTSFVLDGLLMRTVKAA